MLIDSTVTQTNLHVYMTGYIGLSSIYMCIVSLMLFVNYKSETCNVFVGDLFSSAKSLRTRQHKKC